jgi:hypothetical protein
MEDCEMEIDRRAFVSSLGGAAAVALLTPDQKADALEHYMEEQLSSAEDEYPTVASLEAANQDLTRPARRGAGGLFSQRNGKLKKLPPMPEKPTILDFYEFRFAPANHVLQSATRALQTGMREEIILACLLHDVVSNLIRPDHGWWGAQLFEPYVPEITSFAIRYHQTLRFFPDTEYGYEYPESYFRIFGEDYVPEPYLERTHKWLKNHKWYEHPRLVTVNDLYSFDRSAVVTIDPFVDIIGRHFKQPEEGLGWDNSPSSHMWRTMIWPDRRL